MAGTNHALVKDGVIVNVAVADAATEGGAAWLEAMALLYATIEDISAITPEPGVSWVWRSAGVYVPPATLVASTPTLAANGSNSATVTYTDNHSSPVTEVTFNVNGATTTEATAAGVAVITVTASVVGPVIVTCEGLTLVMEAS